MFRDLAVTLWRVGYQAIPAARRAASTDQDFTVRMLGRPAVVVRGEQGARLFYDQSVVARRKAVPVALSALLFGRGAVHGMDGEAHARRKAVFLRLLDERAVSEIARGAARRLDATVDSWTTRERVVVFDELVRAYGGAVLEWADVGCDDAEAVRISHELAAIVDGFGGAGLAYPRAWVARLRANKWARGRIRAARKGRVQPHPDSALGVFGGPPAADLSEAQAAVELLNVLRPTVAVAWLGAFAALALHEHPEHRDALADPDGDTARELFAQEVRRFYPFVPALAGRLTRPVEWGRMRLRRGAAVVLDVVGTNHDRRHWTHPDSFLPERFGSGIPNEYQFVPQGGGRPDTGHRCPGEPLAVELLKLTLAALARYDYDVAPRSRTIDDRRIPTTPAGGLVLTGVRPHRTVAGRAARSAGHG